MVVKGHSKSKQAAFLTTLIICNGVHCVKFNANSYAFNERTESPEQKALHFEPIKITATITPTPTTTSSTATTRKPSKPPVHPSTIKIISDSKENEESSASSDNDADSEDSSSCKNQIYTALMKRIPVGITKMLNEINPTAAYEHFERRVSQSVEESPQSSLDQDSLFKTRGSSNCNPIAVQVASEPPKPMKYFNEKANSKVQDQDEVEIIDDEDSSDSESNILCSDSPYVRASRVNSVDSSSLNPMEEGVVSALQDQVAKNKSTHIFNGIDSMASENFQLVGHVGLFILTQLLKQLRQIPLEPGMSSLDQSSLLLEQLSEVYNRVVEHNRNDRLDCCELIQWCINATLTGDKPDLDRFRIVRDTLLIFVVNSACIFDDNYLFTKFALISFRAAVIYASLHKYYDTVDYIRQVYHFSTISELQEFFQLPEFIDLSRDGNTYLPLKQVYLSGNSLPAPDQKEVKNDLLKKKNNLSTKKNKKRRQKLKLIVHPAVNNAFLKFIITNPVVCFTAIILAIILQVFLFHRN